MDRQTKNLGLACREDARSIVILESMTFQNVSSRAILDDRTQLSALAAQITTRAEHEFQLNGPIETCFKIHYSRTRSRYSLVVVSILMISPISMNAGTVTDAPLSTIACFVKEDEVLPRAAGSV